VIIVEAEQLSFFYDFLFPESQLSDFRCCFGRLTFTFLYLVPILIVGVFHILAGAIRHWGPPLIVITGRWTGLSVRGLAIIRTPVITLVRRWVPIARLVIIALLGLGRLLGSCV
jgi:hypothetical protein